MTILCARVRGGGSSLERRCGVERRARRLGHRVVASPLRGLEVTPPQHSSITSPQHSSTFTEIVWPRNSVEPIRQNLPSATGSHTLEHRSTADRGGDSWARGHGFIDANCETIWSRLSATFADDLRADNAHGKLISIERAFRRSANRRGRKRRRDPELTTPNLVDRSELNRAGDAAFLKARLTGLAIHRLTLLLD